MRDAEGLQHFLPAMSASHLPCRRAAPTAFHRIKNAIRIVNLIDRRRPLGAQPPAAGGMHWVALKLRDLPGFFVDIGQQPASRFAVETNRGNQRVMFLDPPRPSLGIVLNPVVPLLHRRSRGKMAAVAFKIVIH